MAIEGNGRPMTKHQQRMRVSSQVGPQRKRAANKSSGNIQKLANMQPYYSQSGT
jgi:hypothetical protein